MKYYLLDDNKVPYEVSLEESYKVYRNTDRDVFVRPIIRYASELKHLCVVFDCDIDDHYIEVIPTWQLGDYYVEDPEGDCVISEDYVEEALDIYAINS